MENSNKCSKMEVLSIQEYLKKRQDKRKKEEGEWKVLTKIGWNVIIQK